MPSRVYARGRARRSCRRASGREAPRALGACARERELGWGAMDAGAGGSAPDPATPPYSGVDSEGEGDGTHEGDWEDVHDSGGTGASQQDISVQHEYLELSKHCVYEEPETPVDDGGVLAGASGGVSASGVSPALVAARRVADGLEALQRRVLPSYVPPASLGLAEGPRTPASEAARAYSPARPQPQQLMGELERAAGLLEAVGVSVDAKVEAMLSSISRLKEENGELRDVRLRACDRGREVMNMRTLLNADSALPPTLRRCRCHASRVPPRPATTPHPTGGKHSGARTHQP